MLVQLATFSPYEVKIHTESASSADEPSNIQIHFDERKDASDSSERVSAPASLTQLISSIGEYIIRRRNELEAEILAIEFEKDKLSTKICCMGTMGFFGGVSIAFSLLYLAIRNTSVVNHPSRDDISTNDITTPTAVIGSVFCIAAVILYCRYGRKMKNFEKNQQNKRYHSIILSQYNKEDISTKAACLYMDHLEQTKKEKKTPLTIAAYIESPSTLSKIFFEGQIRRDVE